MATISAATAAPNTAPTDVTKLTRTAIGALTATQVKALSADNIRALTGDQLSALTVTALGGLSSTQVGLLAATQVAAFSVTQVRNFSATMINGLTAADATALATTQIAALTTTNIKSLSTTAIAALAATQISALAATTLGALTTAQVNALATTQISAITAAQARGLTATEINSLSDAKIKALGVSALTPLQISGLNATVAASLSSTQLGAWSATQVGSLTTTASSALTSTQVASLNAAQLGAMKSTMVGEAGGLQINLIWAASTSKAPAAFRTAVMTAAKSFTDTYSNPAVVNIQVGFGDTNGTRVSATAVAQSMSAGSYTTYSAVRTALLKDAGNSDYQATADATLSAIDPTKGGKFMVNTAQQKVLGMIDANATAIDGYAGLSSALPMDYAQSGASGKYDAVGAMQHEISEILGRTGSVGKAFGTGVYTALDLFRYKPASGTAPAVRSLTAGGEQDFFSIDGGKTNLGNFNTTTGGDDFADWNIKESGDAYGFGIAGTKSTLPARDIIEMAVLGYNLTASGKAAAKGSNTNAVA